jgi:hypothetical protein
MFPFWWNNSCYGAEPVSRQTYLQRKLNFLKWMRDDLETRLAGLNAAIDNIERQMNQEDAA